MDTALRTDRPGLFAAGNLCHPVDTADIAALDGRYVAARVGEFLDGTDTASERAVRLLPDTTLRWISPGLLRAGAPAPPRGRLLAWTDQRVAAPRITLSQNGRKLVSKRLPWPAVPGRVFRIPAHLLDRVDPAGGDVTISRAAATCSRASGAARSPT